MAVKPTVFVGSSAESISIAYEIQSQLSDDAIVRPWKGLVDLGEFTLEALSRMVDDFDFGVFVFAADDMLDLRGEHLLAARDNVILETGIFIERLSRLKTLVVVQEVSNLRWPSDLKGLTVASFSLPAGIKPSEADPDLLQQALGKACSQLRTVIKKRYLDDPPEMLSGGMIYLLRHLQTRSYSLGELADILIHFNSTGKATKLSAREAEGWGKAAQYALQCLRALRLVDQFGTGEYSITSAGRRLLDSGRLEKRFQNSLICELLTLDPRRGLSPRRPEGA
jgi:hypothetical protein